MLINVKDRVHDDKIMKIMEYAVFPNPERLEQTLNEYKENNDLELFAFEEDGEIIGIIGFKRVNKKIEIRHIAVQPLYRGMGYGRGQLLELIEMIKPEGLVAETDEEAVEFYRRVGFTISSLGEKYPGVERFHCFYQVVDNESST